MHLLCLLQKVRSGPVSVHSLVVFGLAPESKLIPRPGPLYP